jgi:hypothetical protein
MAGGEPRRLGHYRCRNQGAVRGQPCRLIVGIVEDERVPQGSSCEACKDTHIASVLVSLHKLIRVER